MYKEKSLNSIKVSGTKSLISKTTNSRQLPPTMEIVLEMKFEKSNPEVIFCYLFITFL